MSKAKAVKKLIGYSCFDNMKENMTSIFAKHNKLILLVITELVFFFRRPGQFLYPYIWCEDATVILADYIKYGFKSLFMPGVGYYLLSPKIIDFLAFKISFWYYPQIAAFLANIFCLGVIFAIAYSPTRLKLPWLCAILTLFVKTDSENFGTALYTFWWAGLLLVVVTLWDTDKKPIVRMLLLLVGGLSSPTIVIASAVLCLRAFIEKNKRSTIFAVSSLILSAIQLSAIFSENIRLNLEEINIRILILRYFGMQLGFFYKNDNNIFFAAGILVLLLLLFFAFKYFIKFFKAPTIENTTYLTLLAWLIGSILLSVSRVGTIAGPYRAGPRYYFYPFIIFSWIIAYFIFEYKNIVSRVVLILIAFSFIFDGSLKYMSRDSTQLNWHNEILNVLEFGENYKMKVHFDGKRYWGMHIKSDDAKRLISNSLMFRDVNINTYSAKKNRIPDELILALEPEEWDYPEFITINGLSTGLSEGKTYVYSTYCGSDSHKGEIMSKPIEITEPSYFEVSVMYGPDSKNQTLNIVVESEEGKEEIEVKVRGDIVAHTWYPMYIDMAPYINKSVSIMIRDDGQDFGQWMGISQPVLYKER